jgi:hypothetical protein
MGTYSFSLLYVFLMNTTLTTTTNATKLFDFMVVAKDINHGKI